MSAYRQRWARPARAAKPEGKDYDRWRRLIRMAAQAAHRPYGDCSGLTKAGDRAFKAILPPGHQGPGNPFSLPVATARAFSLFSLDQRGREAKPLAELAEQCRVILDGPGPLDQPPPRFRADVDG